MSKSEECHCWQADMQNDEERLTFEKWQAIIDNDQSYNGQFFYAVKTTGIFCKPSCKSRVPKKEHVLIFSTARKALEANFRPCKRCNPMEEKLPDIEWAERIIHYLHQHFSEKITLDTLAEETMGSPYHLQRTFKRIIGTTPAEYLQNVRINRAKEYLCYGTKTISEIALSVGMANTSYFITLFKKRMGNTPVEYRKLHQKEE